MDEVDKIFESQKMSERDFGWSLLEGSFDLSSQDSSVTGSFSIQELGDASEMKQIESDDANDTEANFNKALQRIRKEMETQHHLWVDLKLFTIDLQQKIEELNAQLEAHTEVFSNLITTKRNLAEENKNQIAGVTGRMFSFSELLTRGVPRS